MAAVFTPLGKGVQYLSKDAFMQACELTVLQAGLQFKIEASSKRQYKMVCVDKTNCDFFVNGRPVHAHSPGDAWKVTSLNLRHSCSGDGARRKREVNGKTLDRSSVAAKIFQRPPGRQKGKSLVAKQLVNMMESTDAITIKQSHAAQLLEKKGAPYGPESEVNSFGYLESLVAELRRVDPGGQYKVVSTPDGKGIRRFESVYICHGSDMEFYRRCRKVTAMDATFVDTICGGVILLATVKDANEQIRVLNYMYCAVENGTSWTEFVRNFKRDFPGCTLVLSDREKGLHTALAFFLLLARKCARHLKKNADRAKLHDVAGIIMSLAKSTTWNDLSCNRPVPQWDFTQVCSWFEAGPTWVPHEPAWGAPCSQAE